MRIIDWSSDVCSADLFFFQTTKSTQTMSSYAARLDIALADMIDRPTKGLDELRDEISAACLDSTTLIQDILGQRANLSEALIALAELSTGKRPEEHRSELQSPMRISYDLLSLTTNT